MVYAEQYMLKPLQHLQPMHSRISNAKEKSRRHKMGGSFKEYLQYRLFSRYKHHHFVFAIKVHAVIGLSYQCTYC
jgi:hypothetical protein